MGCEESPAVMPRRGTKEDGVRARMGGTGVVRSRLAALASQKFKTAMQQLK